MICTAALLLNLTSFAWNEHDMKILLHTTQQCVVKYPRSPCLSSFTKIGKQDYRVMCKGGSEDERSNLDSRWFPPLSD